MVAWTPNLGTVRNDWHWLLFDAYFFCKVILCTVTSKGKNLASLGMGTRMK